MGRLFKALLRGAGRLLCGAAALAAALSLTLLMFLVLPFLQRMAHPEKDDVEIRQVSTANIPPPPPPPVEEEPEEEDEEPPPQELADEAPPMDLSQLELALSPGGFGSGAGGTFSLGNLAKLGGPSGDDGDGLFSMEDLDQLPRVVYQPSPEYPAELRRRKIKGTVHVIFVVDKSGRVQQPKIQKSSHPAFEQPALKAVRRWRFEPGKSSGKAVSFKMRIPITFVYG